jgi:hypothetical protein
MNMGASTGVGYFGVGGGAAGRATATSPPRRARAVAGPSPRRQLDGFIDAYSPEVAALGRSVLAKLRKRLPGMVELVYDNAQWLVVGFSPTERPSDAAFSVVFQPRKVSMVFLHGARLPDPDGLLQGSGKQVRNIQLPDAAVLDRPAVRRLMEQELAGAPEWDRAKPGRMVVRAISAKRRPRHP